MSGTRAVDHRTPRSTIWSRKLINQNLALPAQQAPYLTDPQETMGEREAERVERNASLQDRMKEVAERIAELEKRAWVDDVLMRRWDGL